MKLSEFKFEPQHTQEELDTAVAWLTDNSKGFQGTTNFAIVGGSTLVPHIRAVCHRNIELTSATKRSVVATDIGWKRNAKTVSGETAYVETVRPFFDWLTKDSLYKDFILWSDIEHGFVVSADVYTPLMQNLMILTRHFREVPLLAFEAFNSMLANGVPGDIAYPIVFNTTIGQGGREDDKFGPYYAHRVTTLFGLEDYKLWLDRDVGKRGTAAINLNDKSKHYRANKHYAGGSVLFLTEDPRMGGYMQYNCDRGLVASCMSLKEFRDALATSRKGKHVEAYKAPNPFAPTPPAAPSIGPLEITNKEAIEVLGPFLRDYFSSNKGSN